MKERLIEVLRLNNGRATTKVITSQTGITSRRYRSLKEEINSDLSIPTAIGSDATGVYILTGDNYKNYINYNNSVIRALKKQNKNIIKKKRKHNW